MRQYRLCGAPHTDPIAKKPLVAHILKVYYPPNKAPDFDIIVGQSKERWAGLERASGAQSKPILEVSDDVFWTTPAFVVSTLGHEMVHMEQYKRHYKTCLTGITAVVEALREVEAHSWQLGNDKFARSFTVGPLYPFMKDDE